MRGFRFCVLVVMFLMQTNLSEGVPITSDGYTSYDGSLYGDETEFSAGGEALFSMDFFFDIFPG